MRRILARAAAGSAAVITLLIATSRVAAETTPCPDPDRFKVRAWNLQAPDLQAGALAGRLVENNQAVAPVKAGKDAVSAQVVGIDSSQLVLGTAEFLAKRANDEIRFWIKDELLGRLCGADSALKPYFPTLCTLYDSYAFGLAPPDDAIADAFRRDARALPACLVYKNQNGDTGGYLLLEAAQQLRRGTNPLIMFGGLADTEYVRKGCADGKQGVCAFYLTGVTAQSYLVAASVPDPATGAAPKGEALARATLLRFVAKLSDDKMVRLLKNITDWADDKKKNDCPGALASLNPPRKYDGTVESIVTCWIVRNKGDVEHLEKTLDAARSEWDGFRQQLARVRQRDERRELFIDFIATSLARLADIADATSSQFPGLKASPEQQRVRLQDPARLSDDERAKLLDDLRKLSALEKAVLPDALAPLSEDVRAAVEQEVRAWSEDEWKRREAALRQSFEDDKKRLQEARDKASQDAKAKVEAQLRQLPDVQKKRLQNALLKLTDDSSKRLEEALLARNKLDKESLERALRSVAKSDPQAIQALQDALLRLSEDEKRKIDALISIVKLMNAEQYSRALVEVFRCVSEESPCGWNISDQTAARELKRYLPIAFEIADAKSADEVASTLDRVASPIGGWRAKQSQKMWSINAFVGPGWGPETLWKDGSDTGTFRGHNKSLFAPVGVDYSRPTGYRWFPTWGAFVSGLDFGSLMSVGDGRSDGPIQVDSKAKAGFAQILSPGAYAHIGIGKSPFVLGGGVSYYPLSREAKRPDGSTVLLDARVWRVFLGVDLTLMPF